MQRSKLRMRAFVSSQNGAVTVDFLPLACGVIGLGFGVVSFTTAALDSSTLQIASSMDDLEIQTNLPMDRDTDLPQTQTDPVATEPGNSDTPQVEVKTNTGGAATVAGQTSQAGTPTGGSRYTETRGGGVVVTMSGLPDAGGVTVTQNKDESEFGDGWLFGGSSQN